MNDEVFGKLRKMWEILKTLKLSQQKKEEII